MVGDRKMKLAASNETTATSMDTGPNNHVVSTVQPTTTHQVSFLSPPRHLSPVVNSRFHYVDAYHRRLVASREPLVYLAGLLRKVSRSAASRIQLAQKSHTLYA